MAQNGDKNDFILQARSQRLERLLDLYCRGVIALDDFLRLKNQEKKISPARAVVTAETESGRSGSTRSGSTKQNELKQIRDEIRRREQPIEPAADRSTMIDLALYATPPSAAQRSFTTEPMIGEGAPTEVTLPIVSLKSDSKPDLAPALPVDAEPIETLAPPLRSPELSASGVWLSNSMAAVRRSPRSSAALAATFLIAIILTIGIARSGPINQLVDTLQPQYSAASTYASTLSTNRYIRPRFGPQAVRQCLEKCNADSRAETCEKACNRLTLSEFARRITKLDIDPSVEARATIAQCTSQSKRDLAEVSRDTWLRNSNLLIEALRLADTNRTVSDFSRARMEHDSLNQLNEAITVPEQGTLSERSISMELARASCLRVNLDLGEMGLVLARQSSDSFSERFYQRYYEQLYPSAASSQSNVAEFVKKIENLNNARKK